MSTDGPLRPAAGAGLPEGAAPVGADGLRRCPWALGAADLTRYHDLEWGVAVRDDRGLFERLSLEAFQAGLSWLTVLRKREALREVFCGFDLAAVAAFTERDVARLLADPRIIRNRAKIEAVVGNARAALDLPEGLAEFVWRHAPEAPAPAPVTAADVPSSSPESAALARALRRRGFRFVGPTTVHAMMEAVGMVDGHLADCHRRGVAAAGRPGRAGTEEQRTPHPV
ncbi:DNA-3-methyladenine glycosylase I [Thermobifida cellulosilytica]|uniref:3-methyladenine DNA glycosylase n=1 Tax=Thermobifida cellulosilytica TB100 TaxID=665004 RepID=A0A147KH37_THECS|nr:DNA-3-methyladenine glycosylase I [Thermobifida cellulosilytica]KUP96615.1 3-methyladenine DNA glycosylase [Thermobifida cellulosilytica TB100]